MSLNLCFAKRLCRRDPAWMRFMIQEIAMYFWALVGLIAASILFGLWTGL